MLAIDRVFNYNNEFVFSGVREIVVRGKMLEFIKRNGVTYRVFVGSKDAAVEEYQRAMNFVGRYYKGAADEVEVWVKGCVG